MAEYYIVNDVDKPSERHVAELVRDVELRYLSEDLRRWPPMSKARATRMEDFGFVVVEEGNMVRFSKVGESVALYRDGTLRQWQGAAEFTLRRYGR